MKYLFSVVLLACILSCNNQQKHIKLNSNNGHGIIMDTLNNVDSNFLNEVQHSYQSNSLTALAKDSNHVRLFSKTSKRQMIIDNLSNGSYHAMIVNKCDIMVYGGTSEEPEFIYQTTFPLGYCK